jgi:hypothetical protein
MPFTMSATERRTARKKLNLTIGMMIAPKNDRFAPYIFLISAVKRFVCRLHW